jgi:nucleoside-diphosphate-sugar epimerase
MKIAVIGATGFIGPHLVEALLSKGIEVMATGTSYSKTAHYSWFNKVDFLELNIENPQENQLQKLATADKIIHLVWSGLPNYNDLFHFEKNLIPQYNFIKSLVELGVKDITITGTCFEYGMQNGCLNETMLSDPQNPYAIAKDTLRKFLQQLQKKMDFQLKWVRLFYMYGQGQSSKSILSLLENALENRDTIFNMSGGEQLRDYLPIEEVVKNIINISLHQDFNGIINCCSGSPISIKRLVENYLQEKGKYIQLNLGYYPYPDFEPLSFWGNNDKYQSISHEFK